MQKGLVRQFKEGIKLTIQKELLSIRHEILKDEDEDNKDCIVTDKNYISRSAKSKR